MYIFGGEERRIKKLKNEKNTFVSNYPFCFLRLHIYGKTKDHHCCD